MWAPYLRLRELEGLLPGYVDRAQSKTHIAGAIFPGVV